MGKRKKRIGYNSFPRNIQDISQKEIKKKPNEIDDEKVVKFKLFNFVSINLTVLTLIGSLCFFLGNFYSNLINKKSDITKNVEYAAPVPARMQMLIGSGTVIEFLKKNAPDLLTGIGLITGPSTQSMKLLGLDKGDVSKNIDVFVMSSKKAELHDFIDTLEIKKFIARKTKIVELRLGSEYFKVTVFPSGNFNFADKSSVTIDELYRILCESSKYVIYRTNNGSGTEFHYMNFFKQKGYNINWPTDCLPLDLGSITAEDAFIQGGKPVVVFGSEYYSIHNKPAPDIKIKNYYVKRNMNETEYQKRDLYLYFIADKKEIENSLSSAKEVKYVITGEKEQYIINLIKKLTNHDIKNYSISDQEMELILHDDIANY
jgi:hypothetical protein